MKIRFDYVTNSSSTSFVIISKGRPTEVLFLKAMGINKGSPLEPFGKNLFCALSSSMKNVTDLAKSIDRVQAQEIRSFLKDRINTPSIAKRAVEALDMGMDVYIGSLNSDGYPSESFLCTEVFEIDFPGLYINSLECTW